MTTRIITNRQGEDVAQGKGFYRTRSGGISAGDTDLVGANGEYNASSKKDLIQTIANLVDLVEQGKLRSVEAQATVDPDTLDRMVVAARSDRNWQNPDGPFMKLGQVFADTISETMGRQGFTDKILARVDTPERGTPRVEIDRHDVQAVHMTSAGATVEQFSKPDFLYPKGWWLTCQLLIDEEDLFFAGQAFLERKFNAALAATLVREDNVTRFLLDQASTIDNDLISFGAFTPTVWGTLRDQIWRWSLQPPHALMSIDLQRDIFSDADWHEFYSPVEKHVLFQEGKFGSLAGVEVFSDGYRYDLLRVLEPGEVYMLAAPATLGAKLPLRPLESEPISKHAVDGSPRRGWWLGQYEAIVIGNSKGVSKGVKL